MEKGPGPALRKTTHQRETAGNRGRRGKGTGRREEDRGARKVGQRAAAGTEGEMTDSWLRRPAPEEGELRKRSAHKTVESRVRGRDRPQRGKAEMRQKKELRPRSERPAPGREQAEGQRDISSLLPLLAWKGERPQAGTGHESTFCTRGAPGTACKRGRRRSPCCPPGELTPVHSQVVCRP